MITMIVQFLYVSHSSVFLSDDSELAQREKFFRSPKKKY